MSQGGWSILSSRRGLLALGLPLLAGGCGFRPLHGRNAAESAEVIAGFDATRVGLIGERQGQLMRRRLEEALERGSTARANALYELRVFLDYSLEVQGFRRDGTPSRVRFSAAASWFLYDNGAPPKELAHGRERASDSYDIPENQFFAADAARDTMERRLVEQLSGDIIQNLAIYFRSAARSAAPA